ncbi:MAG: fibronectin/fibrinogen-binding protein [Cyanobacteria bacterium K_DeepCast_35m_m2_023]|nr:fibronectin/fibrinogen-binding protein [Cyanobacteria bacterium K_DeepCast_35m_m2_023]
MDLTSLRAVVHELQAQLVPARFEKAQQGDPQAVQLGLRGLGGMHWLALSWQAEAPRLHAIAPPPRQGDGSTLAQQLQHGLRGLALVALQQSGWERVVELGFARRPGEAIERWLVLELMGRHSNLFLLDDGRSVITLARQVRQQQSRLRPIGTGDPYQCPPPLQGEPPSGQEPFALWQRRLQLQELPLREALQRSYQGISPALVHQLVAASLAEQPVSSLSPEQWQALHQRWLQWLAALEQGCFGFVREGPGYRCWLVPGVEAPAPGPTINAALATYYGEILGRRRFLGRQQTTQHRLEQWLAREQGQLQQQQELLLAGEQADALQQQADALLCRAHCDPLAVDQAQQLYRRARRLRRSGAVIRERIALHQQRLQWLEDSLTYLQQTDDLDGLEALARELESAIDEGQVGRPRRQLRRAAAHDQPRPLELCSPAGLRLQVGRNHRQNAWISLRQARRGDLWFHAQECPGSHVVLKASEGVAGDGDLAAAAHLAAYFSRARGNARVPVVMVPTEALQRIPGAPAGTVRHSGGMVIWGIPAEAEPLLSAPPSLAAEHQP